MNAPAQAPVAIVGAGPVGLTLALDLQSRGIASVVIETRRFAEPPSVKCNHVSARSMEQFRRLGLATRLRDAGLPAGYPNDVAFRTTVTGLELSRIPIPCRAERYARRDVPDGWWPTPEPPHRINQIYLEPVLLRHAAAQPGITILNRTAFRGFAQHDAGVQVSVAGLDDGAERTIDCRYLVGCDGGRSDVRRGIGARLDGTPVVQNVQSTFIRAPSLKALIPGEPAWSYNLLNPRRCGTVFAIDGESLWLVHNHLAADETDPESVDRDRCLRTILGVGPDFAYEVVGKEDWVGRRLVADRFRDRRVFIAGDAAHLWMPYAGYGMNAGIADAVNLGWKLAARLSGWGGEALLDSYERERQPITEQVSRFAMDHAQRMIRARKAVPADIERDDAHGERLREQAGRDAFALNVQQFCCAGLNFGYFYDGSPIVVPDDEPAPAYTMGDFASSTVPGCRLPHLWLPDGRSLYDVQRDGFVLVRCDPAVDVAPLRDAAVARGMPLVVVDVDRARLSREIAGAPPTNRPAEVAAYRCALTLARPDQHVAWRGDALPADGAAALLARLCGDPARSAPTEPKPTMELR